MSYVALYRKYRPLNFDEVVGQDHITSILKNQIINDKISHAYIFSGSRGTGKTSTAKIFSRAVNCLNPQDGNPCNECSACKSILNDETTDVIEMDAASNNSVENIRAIRQEVMYASTKLKYKIYIIDEAHMLSTSAFNALLKTLEEPPKNVIFILATTEEHKLLPTILSRCIRFEFKKISIDNVVSRIEYILNDSKIQYDVEALNYVANICDGGMRDALSILERCIDDENNKITLNRIQEIVGISDTNVLNSLAENIIKYDLKEASNLIDKILETGKDVRYITSELLEIFMNKILSSLDDNSNKIRFNYIIKELAKLDASLRQAVNVNILFKAKIIELCTRVIYNDNDELIDKIEKLELRIQDLEDKIRDYNYTIVKSNHNSKKDAPIEDKKPEENVNREEKNTKIKKRHAFKEFDKLRDLVVDKDNLQLYSALAGVKASVDDSNIIFSTENKFAYTILNKSENTDMLKQLTQELINDDYSIKIEYNNIQSVNENKFETHMLNSDIPFTNID